MAASPSNDLKPVPEAGFRAQLRDASLPDLVQMECLSQSHRAIRVTTVGDIGYLYFASGRIVHAATLEMEGEAAAFEILQWTQGTFEPCQREWPSRPTITVSWQTLLILSAQARDERRHNVVKLPAGRERPSQPDVAPASKEREVMRSTLPEPIFKKDEPRLLLRLNSESAVLSNQGASEDYAEMVAYTCLLGDIIGGLFGMDQFRALEYTSKEGKAIIYRELSGDVVALKPVNDASVSDLRERLGL
jgi:hypothetical protein